MKRCSSCEQEKEVDYFSASRQSRDGLQSRCRSCAYEHSTRYQMRLRAEMVMAYGGRCACCGEERLAFLTIDHINGDGERERERVGNDFWSYLKKQGWPKYGLQILCYNCNYGKRAKRQCPHQQPLITAEKYLRDYRLNPPKPATFYGERQPQHRLTENQVRTIRVLCAGGRSQKSLAREFGVSQTTIWRIVRRKKWAHVI